jgi:hypothetical protein
VGFVVDKVALGQVFPEYFGFPCQIFILPIAPQSPSSLFWGLYNRPEVAAVPSGLSPTPLIKKILRNPFTGYAINICHSVTSNGIGNSSRGIRKYI